MTGRGLILAAPASGSGKTLVTAGLARHLRGRGLGVATVKSGPDFIDPTFHATASDKPCVNLDVWGMRPATLAGLVADLEAGADIILCEGVMGLFDGTGRDGEAGSTAELARVTGWPVVLVVDARGQGASVAALLHGFATHQPSVPLAGVIFNRVSSERHGALLAGAAARHLPRLACLGTLPNDPGLVLRSRHLGLVPAGENGDAEAVIERCAAYIGASIDVDRLLSLALGSVFTATARAVPMQPLGQRIAVARDEAFCFAYHAVLEGWRTQGAELAFFSPLADEPPKAGADAVYLPGGYPELWAHRLASAEGFMIGLRRAAARGAVIYGECGGYMVLGDALIDIDGCSRRMSGLLPLVTSFAERRLHLGYRRAILRIGAPLDTAGAVFRGHEFHYATITRQGAAAPLFSVFGAADEYLGAYGLRQGSVFGSFIHLIDRETP
ncbi:MAG TPA: cobyrinate a,c-diamide synthase [Stellaceae bacterium]|nr:cobyrinate a,c-diamide synthase [Stellaceae bacterium]